jgi:hypothetical protein
VRICNPIILESLILPEKWFGAGRTVGGEIKGGGK